MKYIIVFTLSLLALYSYSAEKKPEHREHKAHSHGSGTLSIAFENEKGKAEFKAAAEGVLGFEHKVKTTKDMKTLEQAIAYFKNETAQIIQFESSLHCKFTKDRIGQIPEEGEEGASGEHSDWAADFFVICDKSPAGSKLIVDFTHFKLLKDVDITILVGELQKSAEFKKKPVTIDLK